MKGRAPAGRTGGRAWVDARIPLVPAVAVVPGIEAKSEGFVPGNVHLDAAVSGSLALRLTVP